MPNFAEIRDAFSDVVELNAKKTKLRQENELIDWTPKLDLAFERFVGAIHKSAELNLEVFDSEQPVVIFTDASKYFWSCVVC